MFVEIFLINSKHFNHFRHIYARLPTLTLPKQGREFIHCLYSLSYREYQLFTNIYLTVT